MRTVFWFDCFGYFMRKGFYLYLLLLVMLGYFGGINARFTLAEAVFYNSSYQLGFIIAFLSLVSLFFGTIFSAQMSLKEVDNFFSAIYFTTPLKIKDFIVGRFLSIFALSFFSVFLFTICFLLGQASMLNELPSGEFFMSFYLLPIIAFTFVNTFFVVSFTTAVGWIFKKQLYIYISGLVLYVLYMIAMLFSGSPFMAQSLPQSKQAQIISAVLDPFGLSAYFFQTAHWNVSQRNFSLLPFEGLFLLNRVGVILISVGLLFLAKKYFSFDKKSTAKPLRNVEAKSSFSKVLNFYNPRFNLNSEIRALFSFVKIQMIYVFKSIPFVLILITILFAVGMEMYAEIEKGIRLPQKYATTGIMVSTIMQTFYVLGILIILFYTNDLFWRSKTIQFDTIENTTFYKGKRPISVGITLVLLVVVLISVQILLGIGFQLGYNYPIIEWKLYFKLFGLIGLPLVLASGFALVFNKLIPNKYISLGVSAVFLLLLSTPLAKKIVKFPLLKFLHPISFDYSDMNGFGSYEIAFYYRLLFGFCVIGILILFLKVNRKSILVLLVVSISSVAYFVGDWVVENYIPKDEEKAIGHQVAYEKNFRKFQNLPQPIITDVSTQIDLFPEESSYTIKGSYLFQNKSDKEIDSILINFSDGFKIKRAEITIGNQKYGIADVNSVVRLQQSLLPKQFGKMTFEISYQWYPVNGHQSFNAIVGNGTFMRISRYFPSFGYDSENELQDEKLRGNYNLKLKTQVVSINAPRAPKNDAINLDIIVSTSANQLPIGIGETISQWKSNNRNYTRFLAKNIPFRFAVSSAEYAVNKSNYKGKSIEVYYHPTHYENVENLVFNAKETLDYCETNFGNYPFKTIRFAEVSSFTRDFAATAYPATIYMTENMIFHCNTKADKKQDVINELAGHELGHMWWGGNQVVPDNRQGAAVLTETLAMYTEMMLLKKMYGKNEMLKRVKMHLDIYKSQRGFSKEVPLFLALFDDRYLTYSKGAVVMNQLSELIGEDKVNLALKNFLIKNKYSIYKPMTIDLIEEFYKVSDKNQRAKIEKLFKEI